MDDGTSGWRFCEVCGDRIRPRNKWGICFDPKKSECRKARLRKQYGLPEPALKDCSVCGDPIRNDNDMGICQRNLECRRARTRKFREDGPLGKAHHREAGPTTRYCDVCGGRIRRDNATGVCDGRGKPACQQERERRRGRRRGASPVILESFTPPPYLAAGTVFGRLTVLEDVYKSTDSVLCRCECGTEKRVSAIDLTTGKTRSCGCLRRERTTTHGLSKHPLYRSWAGIVSRTTDPNSAAYPNYGGRGIRISERWLDLAAFIEDIEREIGPRPAGVTDAGWPLYTLDRINVEGHYESGNVQWGSWAEQAMNKRKIPDLTEQRDALAVQVKMLTAQLQALAEQSSDSRKRQSRDI